MLFVFPSLFSQLFMELIFPALFSYLFIKFFVCRTGPPKPLVNSETKKGGKGWKQSQVVVVVVVVVPQAPWSSSPEFLR